MDSSSLWWKNEGQKQKRQLSLNVTERVTLSLVIKFKKLLPSCTAAAHSLFHLLHFSVQSLVSHSKADLYLMDHFANIYHLKEKQNEKKQNTLSLLLSVIFDPNLKTFCCRGVKCLICTLLLFENLNLSSME